MSINFNCVNNTDSLSLLLLASVCIGRTNFSKSSYNVIFLKQLSLKYGTDFCKGLTNETKCIYCSVTIFLYCCNKL